MSGGTGDAMIIANSQRMFVDTLASAVQREGFTVAHATTTRAGLLEGIERHRDAICLSAWTFTDGGLAEVMTEIRSTAPASRIVVLSSDSDPMTLSAALNVGVQGFIHTSRGLDVLLDAVRRLRLGEIVIEASLSDTSTPGSTEARRVRKLATY